MLQELSTWKRGNCDLSIIPECVNIINDTYIRACKICFKKPEVEEKGMADILLFVLGRQSIRPETSSNEKQNWLFGLRSINWEDKGPCWLLLIHMGEDEVPHAK